VNSEGTLQGRIIKGIGGFYYISTEGGIYESKARGIFRKEGITPLVGDLCEIDIVDEEEKTGNIINILPRKSALIRPAAANADQAVMIFAIKKPEISTGLLDRFLMNMEKQDMETVIVFSKTDLEEPDELMDIYGRAGYRVISVSNKTGEGISELKTFLKGKISVLSGPSGVGKSSLINSLLEQDYAETGELSGKIGRGKNTTRHTELINLDEDSFIMDTPGYSSIEIMYDDVSQLHFGFREMKPYIGKCRFAGCSHISEPDCAVKKAVEEGKISSLRYDSYVQIYNSVKLIKRY
jgi:ribosome small subunit-dependent GTPase A